MQCAGKHSRSPFVIHMRLTEVAAEIRAEMIGDDVAFHGCTTDSRSVEPGQLFIALRGKRFDGHDFINQAVAGGAVAIMGEQHLQDCIVPILKVAETCSAMGALAAYWRHRFAIPVIAITGSNGKTTVKEMLNRILSLSAPVLSTRGNLNNEIGVPMTLFRLGEKHRYAVIEIGANAPGEILGLSKMVRPTVALITQCAPAHLEGFGSIESVARAKAEIYAGLPDTGTAIINMDDRYAPLFQEATRHLRKILFGTTRLADVRFEDLRIDPDTGANVFKMIAWEESTETHLTLAGRHNVLNALAAAACCLALDISLDCIRSGLEEMQPVPGRLQFKTGMRGTRIYDDTYNANPGSLEAALQTLGALRGRNWLVLGDMAELGTDTPAYHLEAGEKARLYGFEKLYAVGRNSVQAVRGFGNGALHFDSQEELVRTVREQLPEGARVLVKGSRSMAMERIVAGLVQED